ncbi:MAG: arginine deiminase family protein [Desulfobacterales bacterium]|nr:arginine deiminase family protein [Desulfobacterales bacterium]
MSRLEKIPFYQKDMPHKPIYGIDFLDEVEMAWGEKWGLNSTFGKIRKILVYRPGEEQKEALIQEDLQLFNLPEGPSDFEKMQEQHDEFVTAMENEGIEVIFLEPRKPLIGTYGIPIRSAPFLRETITVRGGVIICRLAVAYKKGLEAFAARRVAELGCPILHTIHGMGVFEASNMVWIDEKSVILATGLRSNAEGLRQVEAVLRAQGVEDIHHAQLPGYLQKRTHQVGPSSGIFHLDMTFGMAYYNIAVLWPGGVGYDTVSWLEEKGIDIIELSEEELHLCAPNLLPIAPKKVISPATGINMNRELEKRGIEVVEVDLSEFAKAGGGPTCLTLPLVRD